MSSQAIRSPKTVDASTLTPQKLRDNLPVSDQDKQIVIINKSRAEVAEQMKSSSERFRMCMVGASVLATLGVAVKVATVVGLIGLGATPVGWILGGVALLVAAIGVGILIHRHLEAKNKGYKPETLQELGIGLLYGTLAGTATAIVAATVILICLAVVATGGKGLGDGGGGCWGGGHGGFGWGFMMGYSWNSPRTVYVISPNGGSYNGVSGSGRFDTSEDGFVRDGKRLYVYRGDLIQVRT